MLENDKTMISTDKVKVAVRLRPFNRREIDLGSKCIVDMENRQTILYHPSSQKDSVTITTPTGSGNVKKSPKIFAFDHCFWSMNSSEDDKSKRFSSQDKVFNDLGTNILERAFEGYNACIFAYGQTGSGKSYTMMGTAQDSGLIPRLCDNLFNRIESSKNDLETECKTEVSYMEIYCEKVRDLLDPKGKHNLKVREHNILGPYVDGLSTLAVSSFDDVNKLMIEGNKSRTVAATNMNSESSRSHAVFTIKLTQTLTDLETEVCGEKVSKLSLVDLAGSERAQKTGAVGERLKEGSNINKSLTTLGLVISALSDRESSITTEKFIPYRDSVLTWLLKDNLGGNSKTVMVATISPAADNYEETLSTLRYADRAKRIVCHAVVNEDPNARIIRELRDEVEQLRRMLNEAQSLQAPELKDRLEESEKLMKDMSKTWKEKLLETEHLHEERHMVLEKMGISVQTSGIKVGKGKFYLVNLNADPSMNELLVYYLKDTNTTVGRGDESFQPDIQLCGLGIAPYHADLEIVDQEVWITPQNMNFRTCLNGQEVKERMKIKHGDRLVWGMNHFFRINCPTSQNSPGNNFIDYEFAESELLSAQGTDPIREAIDTLQKQHRDDKEEALAHQRQMYEQQMRMLKSQLMSPASTPNFTPLPFNQKSTVNSVHTPTSGILRGRYQQLMEESEADSKSALNRLKEDVIKANRLANEANLLAKELKKNVEFGVTLQIPAANLTPNRRRVGAFSVTEPAIVVRRPNSNSPRTVCCLEEFEHKIIAMRELYQIMQTNFDDDDGVGDSKMLNSQDPFYEAHENHNLIGVANVFLQVLFYDGVTLDYQVPIISQQGDVAGRLGVSISKSSIDTDKIECKIEIKEARGLPHALAHFVFCQYAFWNDDQLTVVPPLVDLGNEYRGNCFRFNHQQVYEVSVNEEFLEYINEGALSIQVWGHRSDGLPINHEDDNFNNNGISTILPQLTTSSCVSTAASRSLAERWAEVRRRLEFGIEIHELTDNGEYAPVELLEKSDVPCGGVFQLRQGYSHRIHVRLRRSHHQDAGTLPLLIDSIENVSIGCVSVRSSLLQKGLDSYQEDELLLLRNRWSAALDKRRSYLDSHLQTIINKGDNKTESDVERERALIQQWVLLTEERNAVQVPLPGIPGALADWIPPKFVERHIPIIFLDISQQDLLTVPKDFQTHNILAGFNAILPKEHGGKFFSLPIINSGSERGSTDVWATTSWDSSIHESPNLNRVTSNGERVYLIVKIIARLSLPTTMDLVLRKRIAVNVYKRQSLTDRLKKKFKATWLNGINNNSTSFKCNQESVYSSNIIYDIINGIPKTSEELEDRETLAQMAASGEPTTDGESYIEKYLKGVNAVESILTLDRLRQDIAIKELLAQRGKPLRKATSVPNIYNMISASLQSLDTITDQRIRSDSIQDLTHSISANDFLVTSNGVPQATSVNSTNCVLPSKPAFNFARPNFLNLRGNLTSNKRSVSVTVTTTDTTNMLTNAMSNLYSVNGTQNSRHTMTTVMEEQKSPIAQIWQNNDNEKVEKILENVTPESSGYGSVPTNTLNSEDQLIETEALQSNRHLNDVASNNTNENNEENLDEKINLSNIIVDDVKKRLRANANSPPTTTISPIKATYRPTLNEQDQVNELIESNIIKSDQDDYGNEDDSVSVCSFGSRGDLNRLTDGVSIPSWLVVGIHVNVINSHPNQNHKAAKVMFVGRTEFSPGIWIGVELEQPDGKNDGSVKGVRYFKCRKRHGLFVRHDKIIIDRQKQLNLQTKKNIGLRKSTDNLPTTVGKSSLFKHTSASAAKHK